MVMAKRGGVKHKINKRIAHVKWLLFKKQPPPPWATAQKLQSELDFLKSSIEQKKPLTPAHSAIKVINSKITPPLPKPLPKREKTCPKDCPGPLESTHCEMTCGEKPKKKERPKNKK